MIKRITILLFLIATIFSYSQTSSGNEITSEGNSKIKAVPDLASLTITINKRNSVEKNAIKELNEEVAKLQKVFAKVGFTDKNIKISDYRISNNENDDDKKEYTSSNSLSVTFTLDNKVIEAFYQEVQNENLKDLDINFETHISEDLEKLTKKKLIQLAIEDAKNNAENIAKTLDVKINGVKQVTKYGFRNVDYASYKSDKKYSAPQVDSVAFVYPKTSFDKYQVEEMEMGETITIVYEIIKK